MKGYIHRRFIFSIPLIIGIFLSFDIVLASTSCNIVKNDADIFCSGSCKPKNYNYVYCQCDAGQSTCDFNLYYCSNSATNGGWPTYDCVNSRPLITTTTSTLSTTTTTIPSCTMYASLINVFCSASCKPNNHRYLYCQCDTGQSICTNVNKYYCSNSATNGGWPTYDCSLITTTTTTIPPQSCTMYASLINVFCSASCKPNNHRYLYCQCDTGQSICTNVNKYYCSNSATNGGWPTYDCSLITTTTTIYKVPPSTTTTIPSSSCTMDKSWVNSDCSRCKSLNYRYLYCQCDSFQYCNANKYYCSNSITNSGWPTYDCGVITTTITTTRTTTTTIRSTPRSTTTTIISGGGGGGGRKLNLDITSIATITVVIVAIVLLAIFGAFQFFAKKK